MDMVRMHEQSDYVDLGDAGEEDEYYTDSEIYSPDAGEDENEDVTPGEDIESELLGDPIEDVGKLIAVKD